LCNWASARRAGDGDAAGGKVESGHHREFGRIGHDLDPEPYFGERYRTDVKQFEWLGGNEWYPAASPSQSNVARRHAHAPRLDIDVTMRRCLHSGNERLPREIAFEAAKLFRGDDDHFVTPMQPSRAAVLHCGRVAPVR
jgi:hypothetical protein